MGVLDVGFTDGMLGNFYDFYVSNTFYQLAPDYYASFYSVYLNRCLAAYDGWINGWHNKQEGLTPQRMLQSVARGLNNMLFAHGLDFSAESTAEYEFACRWAKKAGLYKSLKKAHLFAIAGGTALLKLNRDGKDLYATAHRVDTFFADINPSGAVDRVRIYYDAMHNADATNGEQHYGIFEERYFNEDGIPCVECKVYCASANLQTETMARPKIIPAHNVNWENLPSNVKRYIKENYPSVLIGKPQFLPFKDSLGCFLIKFTDDIPQVPNTPFGQPIGDILYTENFQYDQMKLFERKEVHLARGRALIPEEMWNKDDPNYDRNALNEDFFQKVGSINGDENKITPIQFQMRSTDIRTQMENIYRDISFKLGISASSVASFLSEGAGARTATEIVSERTKSDTWIDSQINLNKPAIDELLYYVMLYYNHRPCEIVFKTENQSPELETLKTWGDQFTAGNISPELFVRKVHKNLSQAEQEREIENLKAAKQMNEAVSAAYTMQ